jgi:hypothetical protein
MKYVTDQQLRKTMEDADPGELIPGFDPDKGWQAVQQKSKQRPRLLFWMKKTLPYAAMLVLGILLSGIIVPVLHRGDKNLVAIRLIRAPVVLKDTVASVKQALTFTPASRPKLKKARYTPGEHWDEHPDTGMPAGIPVPEIPVPEIAQAAAVPISLPVRHYIDVVENATPAPGLYYAAQKQKRRFLRSRIARQATEMETPRKEELPLRGLLYALNQ